MGNSEKPYDDETPRVVDIDRSGIARFARECYFHEPGTKKAVDDGIITMLELEITHYINAWANENTPSMDDPDESEKAYMAKLEEAYLVAASVYSIDVSEARRIFEKVSRVRRA